MPPPLKGVKMAQNRSHEINQIKRDLGKLKNASMTVLIMLGDNNKLDADLSDLANAYSNSAMIPQEDFQLKMKALNEDIRPSLNSINDKIKNLTDELNDLLERYEEEQRKWEEEEREREREREREQSLGQGKM